MRTRTVGMVGAVALATVLAGCANVGSGSGAGIQSSTTGPGTTQPSTSSSAPPSTMTHQPVSASTAGCDFGQLRSTIAERSGAAGSTYLTIRLVNGGTSPCHLMGYPGVSIVAHPGGPQVGAAAMRESTSKPPSVVVPAGGSTTFVLRVGQAANYPRQTCMPVTAAGFRIYPPNSTHAIFLADANLVGCARNTVTLMSVRPVGAPIG